MHEVEDLVESSIRFLDKSPESASLDLRSMFWNLFEYQKKFDTGDTLFRAVDVLIKHRYVYVLPVTEHPEYEKYKSYFDGLNDNTAILNKPTEEWDEENNRETGCNFADVYKKWGEKFAKEIGAPVGPKLYVQAGGECWKKLAAQGKFTGKDAEPPQIIDIIDLAETIVDAAVKNKDLKLAAWWYKVGLPYEISSSDRDFKLLPKDAKLQKLKKIAEENKLMDIEVNGYNQDMLASLDDAGKDLAKFLKWWFFLKK